MLALPLLDATMRLGAISAPLAFRCTLGVVFLNTLFSATAQNSLYGLGGMLGDAATQALQAGTGVIGVVAVAARALTKLGMPPAASMLSFCAGGAALVLGSLGAYYAALADPALGAAVDAHDAERRRRRAERRAERAGGLAAPMLPRRAGGGVHTWRAVVGRVWVEALSAFVVFFVCLACFPGAPPPRHARDARRARARGYACAQASRRRSPRARSADGSRFSSSRSTMSATSPARRSQAPSGSSARAPRSCAAWAATWASCRSFSALCTRSERRRHRRRFPTRCRWVSRFHSVSPPATSAALRSCSHRREKVTPSSR